MKIWPWGDFVLLLRYIWWVWCGCNSDTVIWVRSISNKFLWGSNQATHHTPESLIVIRHNTEGIPHMVHTHRIPDLCFICKRKLCNTIWLEAHKQQYDLMSISEGLLPNGVPPPAGCHHPEPSWFDYSRFLLATVPVLDPAGIIGLHGNSLTPSKIDDFICEPSLWSH